jgi:hypothetical protein
MNPSLARLAIGVLATTALAGCAASGPAKPAHSTNRTADTRPTGHPLVYVSGGPFDRPKICDKPGPQTVRDTQQVTGPHTQVLSVESAAADGAGATLHGSPSYFVCNVADDYHFTPAPGPAKAYAVDPTAKIILQTPGPLEALATVQDLVKTISEPTTSPAPGYQAWDHAYLLVTVGPTGSLTRVESLFHP